MLSPSTLQSEQHSQSTSSSPSTQNKPQVLCLFKRKVKKMKTPQLFILSLYGKIKINNGSQHKFKLSRVKWNKFGAVKQIDTRLFFCGGSQTSSKGELQLSNIMFFSDSEGLCTSLASMRCPRQDLSLGGSSQYILAAGGLECCQTELYHIKSNKWTTLPCLSHKVIKPGICLVESHTALSFSGESFQAIPNLVVESIQLSEPRQPWKMHHFVFKLPSLSRMGAFSLQGNIYLFGIEKRWYNKMLCFSEEGQKVKNVDISGVSRFCPTLDSSVEHEGKLYALQVSGPYDEWKLALWEFDGMNWTTQT